MYNNERVKVVDLGCSNFYAEGISRQTTIGTKLYWSPEIIGQEEQNDRFGYLVRRCGFVRIAIPRGAFRWN